MREGEGCWVGLGEGPEGLVVDREPHLTMRWDLGPLSSWPPGPSLTFPLSVRIPLCAEPADRQPVLFSKKGERLTSFVNSQPACLAFQSTGCHDIPSLTLGTFQAVPELRPRSGGDMKAACVALYAQRRSR